jgi:hypothetical protein
MSDLQSISEPSSRDHVHTNVGPEAPNAAVISILLVGDVVLAIGLIRATFSTKLHAEGAPTTTRETASDSLGLPIFELLKAVVDAIATVLKGLPKR